MKESQFIDATSSKSLLISLLRPEPWWKRLYWFLRIKWKGEERFRWYGDDEVEWDTRKF